MEKECNDLELKISGKGMTEKVQKEQQEEAEREQFEKLLIQIEFKSEILDKMKKIELSETTLG